MGNQDDIGQMLYRAWCQHLTVPWVVHHCTIAIRVLILSPTKYDCMYLPPHLAHHTGMSCAWHFVSLHLSDGLTSCTSVSDMLDYHSPFAHIHEAMICGELTVLFILLTTWLYLSLGYDHQRRTSAIKNALFAPGPLSSHILPGLSSPLDTFLTFSSYHLTSIVSISHYVEATRYLSGKIPSNVQSDGLC